MVSYEPNERNSMNYFRKSLRNPNIDYSRGLFFVTFQVSWNKSLLGAIVGDSVVLNSFGRAIEALWRVLPEKYPELILHDFIFMPNHFHAIVEIRWRASNKSNHLGFLLGRFKGASAHLYGEAKRRGEIADIGEHLWQRDYWDDLISSRDEYDAINRYIRDNPKNWSRDRWGAVTTYSLGNLSLLNRDKTAFIASQGFFAADLRPRCLKRRSSQCGTSVPKNPLISTFTSAQEREALRRALAKGKPIIMVVPGGISSAADISPELAKALDEDRALLISPQPTGSRLNKKVATWCNEYVLRQSSEIWAGDISPNGMLSSMLAGMGLKAFLVIRGEMAGCESIDARLRAVKGGFVSLDTNEL